MKETKWLSDLLYEISLDAKDVSSIHILCDGQATLARANSEVYNRKSRHMNLKHEYVRILIKHRIISFSCTKFSESLADPLTIPLTRDQ